MPPNELPFLATDNIVYRISKAFLKDSNNFSETIITMTEK